MSIEVLKRFYKGNKVIGYRLIDRATGSTRDVSSKSLKTAIINNRIKVSNIKLTSDGRLVKVSKTKKSPLDSLKELTDLKTDLMKFAEKVCRATGLEVDYNKAKDMDYSIVTSKHDKLDWCDIEIQIVDEEPPIYFYITSLDRGVSQEGGFAAEVQVKASEVKELVHVIHMIRVAKNRVSTIDSVDELAKCFEDTFVADKVSITSDLGYVSIFEIETIDLEYALCKAANKIDLYRKYFIHSVKKTIKKYNDDFKRMMSRLLEECEVNDEELDYYALVLELYTFEPDGINYDCVQPAGIIAKSIMDRLGVTDEVDKIIEVIKKYR